MSPMLASSSYRILKMAERDTAVSVFVGCTIPSLHCFRNNTVTRLCKNVSVISALILRVGFFYITRESWFITPWISPGAW